MDTLPVTNQALGDPISTKEKVLTTGAGLLQPLEPPKQLCAHLNAFHAYFDFPHRHNEANHYCAHVNEDVRQCLLYDSPAANARLIGVEYMITPRLYATIADPAERARWHSHVFEVRSGMLIMPTPPGVPYAVWQQAENAEMEAVMHLYGKAYTLWQTDRGDALPLGEPQLMTSFTARDQFDFDGVVGERDRRFGVDAKQKAESRKYIEEPDVDPDADAVWKEKK